MDNCIVCQQPILALMMLNNRLITICGKCGAIVIDNVTVIQMTLPPLQLDNELYYVAWAMAELYKHVGSIDYVPMPE